MEFFFPVGVVGKFVEFYGSGVSYLSIADRATISNMCPEFGGTCGFFAVDYKAIEYLRQTSKEIVKNNVKFDWRKQLNKFYCHPYTDRSPEKINVIEQYLKATKQFRDYNDSNEDPIFTKVRVD